MRAPSITTTHHGAHAALRGRAPAPSSRVRALTIVTALLAALLLGACERTPPPDVHRTRGLVRAVEGVGDELRVAIHHEAIAGFRDRERKPAPMPSMPMIFALQRGVSADGLAPGAKVALAFEVRWDERPTLVITELLRLPADSALALSDDH